MGGEMKQFYMVMGEFDFIGICEVPDDAVMARYVLQLGGLGFVRTKTLKAFPETAYREISCRGLLEFSPPILFSDVKTFPPQFPADVFKRLVLKQ